MLAHLALDGRPITAAELEDFIPRSPRWSTPVPCLARVHAVRPLPKEARVEARAVGVIDARVSGGVAVVRDHAAVVAAGANPASLRLLLPHWALRRASGPNILYAIHRRGRDCGLSTAGGVGFLILFRLFNDAHPRLNGAKVQLHLAQHRGTDTS